MPSKKLEMIFLNDKSNRFTLSIDNPKSSLDKETAEEAMNQIIEENIFSSNDSDLTAIYGARIVTRLVEDLI